MTLILAVIFGVLIIFGIGVTFGILLGSIWRILFDEPTPDWAILGLATVVSILIFSLLEIVIRR